MRRIKIVMYGETDRESAEDIVAWEDDLKTSLGMDQVTIFTVDPLNEKIKEQARDIVELRAQIAELTPEDFDS